MRPYRFSEEAKIDLKAIASYIRKDNPAAAKRVVAKLRDVCRTTLVMFPNGGTSRNDLLPELRCFSVGSYVVFFRSRDPVEIVRVIHGSMDINSATFEI